MFLWSAAAIVRWRLLAASPTVPDTVVTLSHRSESFSRAKMKNRKRVEELEKAGRLKVLLPSSVKRIDVEKIELEHAGQLHHDRQRCGRRMRWGYSANAVSREHRGQSRDEVWHCLDTHDYFLAAVWPLAGLAVIAEPALAQGNDRATPAPNVTARSERPGPLLDSPPARPESATVRAVNAAIRLGQFRQAFALLETAANSGDDEAQYLLSSFYRSGRGVRQDDALAFKWMKAAAERGHTRAQFNLATMYLTARGVAFDVGQAQSWLRKAAAKGDERASKLLADIAARPPTPPKNGQTAALGNDAPKIKAAASYRLVCLRKQPSETDVRR